MAKETTEQQVDKIGVELVQAVTDPAISALVREEIGECLSELEQEIEQAAPIAEINNTTKASKSYLGDFADVLKNNFNKRITENQIIPEIVKNKLIEATTKLVDQAVRYADGLIDRTTQKIFEQCTAMLSKVLNSISNSLLDRKTPQELKEDLQQTKSEIIAQDTKSAEVQTSFIDKIGGAKDQSKSHTEKLQERQGQNSAIER